MTSRSTGSAFTAEGAGAREPADQAAYWAARLDAVGDQGDATQVPGLNAWLAADRAHAGALLRARAMLAMFAPDEAIDAAAMPVPAQVDAPDTTPGQRRWLWLGGALAGGLAACLAVVMWVGHGGEHYETGIGETRQLSLHEGSSVAMDSGSRIAVAVDQTTRQVRMLGGRALFRVRHDAAHPFRVQAGGVTITDVGTLFQVSDMPGTDGVEVLVAEGAVDVDTADGHTRLVAGQRGRFAAQGTGQWGAVSPAAIERALAWTSGRFDLDGEPMAQAVAEMNRHNRLQIRLADPALAREKLYGGFRLDDPQGFARTAAASVNAQTRESSGEIVIARK